MDFGVFDNDEDDGQLSMFDMGIDLEDLQEDVQQPRSDEKENAGMDADRTERKVADAVTVSTSARIGKCTCCGRMLLIREDHGGVTSICPACNVTYRCQ